MASVTAPVAAAPAGMVATAPAPAVMMTAAATVHVTMAMAALDQKDCIILHPGEAVWRCAKPR